MMAVRRLDMDGRFPAVEDRGPDPRNVYTPQPPVGRQSDRFDGDRPTAYRVRGRFRSRAWLSPDLAL